MANPIHTIISELYRRIQEWAALESPVDTEFVWNEDLNVFLNPGADCRVLWIVVGNNPGPEEAGKNDPALPLKQYFSPRGQTGGWTRMTLGHVTRDQKNEVLFLNKSPIFSPQAEQLALYKRHPAYAVSQREFAKAIYLLHRATYAHVWIQGHQERLFTPFFEQLRQDYNSNPRSGLRDRLFITDHAGYKHFFRSFSVDTFFHSSLESALAAASVTTSVL